LLVESVERMTLHEEDGDRQDDGSGVAVESKTPVKARTLEDVSEMSTQSSTTTLPEEPLGDGTEKFNFSKFLDKWKKPEALPLNLLTKK